MVRGDTCNSSNAFFSVVSDDMIVYRGWVHPGYSIAEKAGKEAKSPREKFKPRECSVETGGPAEVKRKSARPVQDRCISWPWQIGERPDALVALSEGHDAER